MKWLVRFVIASLMFPLFFSACTTTPNSSHESNTPLTIDLDALANRTYESPWAVQPPYGFREWFERDTFLYNGIPFRLQPEGKVISLEQYQDATIELPAPRVASAIHILCCGCFLYEETLDFFVEVQTSEGKDLVVMQAHEWYEPLDPIKGQRPYTVRLFKNFVDGHDGIGQIGITSQPIHGTVKRLRIINNSKNKYQQLMIAAITLE